MENYMTLSIEKIEDILRHWNQYRASIRISLKNHCEILTDTEEMKMKSSDFLSFGGYDDKVCFSSVPLKHDIFHEIEMYKKNLLEMNRESIKAIEHLRIQEAVIYRVHNCMGVLPVLGMMDIYNVLYALFEDNYTWDAIIADRNYMVNSKSTMQKYKKRGLETIKQLYESEFNIDEMFELSFPQRFQAYLTRQRLLK